MIVSVARGAVLAMCGGAATLLGQSGRAATAGAASQAPSGMVSPYVAGMPAGTAAVSGVIRDAVTREPLSGAAVILTDGAANPAPAVRMFTDSKGRFVFRQLPASNQFELTAAKSGYFDGAYGKNTQDATAAHLVLAEGQWLSDVSVGLWRPGAITGVVSDEQGEPAVGIFVRALQEIRISGRAQYAVGPTVKTDDRGVYRVTDLVPGRYLVLVPSVQSSVPSSTPSAVLSRLSQTAIDAWEASGKGVPPYTDPGLNVDPANRLVLGAYLLPPAAGGRAMAYPPAFYPNVTSAARATAIELGPGVDRAGIDLRLEPQPASRISGIVQSPSGGPVPRFTLRLVVPGNEGLGHGGETATALVGEDGRFVFLNVPAGEYVIEARGWLAELQMDGVSQQALPPTPGVINTFGSGSQLRVGPPNTGLRTDDNSAGLTYWGRANVTAEGRDVANVVVPLRPSVAIAGHYVYEGKATPPDSGPFQMRLEPANGDLSLGVPGTNILRNEWGAFRYEGLMPGEYVLNAATSAFSPWVVKSIRAGGRDDTYGTFDGSRDVEDVLVTFTDDTATLTGTVRGPTGAPVSSAALIVFPAEKAQWRNYGLRPERIVTTRLTSAGDFRVPKLPAGNYLIIAVDEREILRWQDPAFLEAAAGMAARVSLAWGETKNVDAPMVVVR